MNEQQVEKASRIASLIVRNMQDKLTGEERHELDIWLQADGENFLLYEELMDEYKLNGALDELYAIDSDMAYQRLSQRIFTQEQPEKRNSFKIWWYMVAATLLLIAGGVAYFAVNKTKKENPALAVTITAQKKAAGGPTDTKKATLTLANGSTIVLNEMNNGAIAQQGQVIVHKNRNGALEYTLSGEPGTGNTTGYNTIQTPRGGEYQVVLDDGTRIWLNSASTLTFPIHFNGDQRRVTLTGEAYFEVAHVLSKATGTNKSFIVGVDNMQVQAMGTAFNISAYKEDNNTQTTVVEGVVKVSRQNKDHILQPGKKLITHDSTATVEDADVKLETAWKEGDFVFRNTSLQMVMNELARWYDMEVVYEQPVPSLHFSGEIPRESAIDKVLQMLEYTGGVKFTVTGRVIKVRHNKQ